MIYIKTVNSAFQQDLIQLCMVCAYGQYAIEVTIKKMKSRII